MLNKSLYNKIASEHAWKVVNQYRFMFLQFSTFTYLKVGYFNGETFMLPRYPSNKIVLMELACQMNAVHEAQSGSHKIGLKFTLTIGRYSINSIFKARAIEEKMRRVTMRFFKARKDFDYRGMINKLKKAYVHVHRIKDVWVDYRSKHDIRKLDYC